MEFKARELIFIMKNTNREVGKEIDETNCFSRDNEVLSALNKAIDKGVLFKSKEFETSINKLSKVELEKILVENNIKKTGRKDELIDRIRENRNKIGKIDLPIVYKATDKGGELIRESEYLNKFLNNLFLLSLERAYYIMNNYLEDSVEDKIESIYKFEISKFFNSYKISGSESDLESFYILSLNLVDYYMREKTDYVKARKCDNIILFIKLGELVNEIKNMGPVKLRFYDIENEILDYEYLGDTIRGIINYSITITYENLIFNENLSIEEMFELLKEDIQSYIEYYIWDDRLYYCLVKLIDASIKKKNETFLLTELLKYLDENYVPEPEVLGFDYYEKDEDDYVILTFEELLEIRESIKFMVSRENGDILPYLEESRLDILNRY